MSRDWKSKAACVNAPVDLFITFGDQDDEPYYPSKEALAFCDNCPVRPECLQWAYDHNETGTWGGTTTYQRTQLQRDRERVKCPGCASADVVFEGTIQLCLSCGVSWRII
jgi:WhiB family transcriptional regulator, redox-sensing transcriptional regulator